MTNPPAIKQIAKVPSQPRILIVGGSSAPPGMTRVQIGAKTNYSDYDLLVLDTSGVEFKGEHGSTLSMEELSVLRNAVEDTMQRLVRFVQSGKPAVVLAARLPTAKYYDEYGERVAYDFNQSTLWYQYIRDGLHGTAIQIVSSHPAAGMLSQLQELASYQLVFHDVPRPNVIATVASHPDEVVAFLLGDANGGQICVLPHVDRSNLQKATRLQHALKSLHNALQISPATMTLPEWAEKISAPGEEDLLADIAQLTVKRNAIDASISSSREQLSQVQNYKYLLSGYGTPLEALVIQMLRELGLEANPGPKVRADIYASHATHNFVIEVQGVKASAKEDHARSLAIWVEERAAEISRDPKGILLVNAYREQPLDKRAEAAWPTEVVKIAQRKGFCCLTTRQFLNAFFSIRQGKLDVAAFLNQILATEGILSGFENDFF